MPYAWKHNPASFLATEVTAVFSRRHLQKDSTQGMQWAYFQGFAPPETLAEYAVATRKGCDKPLKI
jgi:hypothetical protein